MGKRKAAQQEQMFIPPARGDGHRFYQALDKLLREADFDAKVEALCEPHYAAADRPGRPSLAPGIFFRMMLVGYFENIASERGICWRCADSFSLRDFLGLANHVPVPDQTTMSRTRRRLPVETFDEVFHIVLTIVAAKGLLKGRVRGVDSTYLQADASMKSIVRKDTGENYAGYIRRLATEAGDTEAGDTAAGDATAPAADRNEGDPPPPSEPPQGGGTSPSADAPPPADGASEAPAEAAPARRATKEEAVRHDRKRSKRTSNRGRTPRPASHA